MVYNSLNSIAPDNLKSMFTDQSAISTYSFRNCGSKLAVLRPRTNFLKEKTVSAVVVRCCGTAYLPICCKHKLFRVLNPGVGVSFLTMIN